VEKSLYGSKKLEVKVEAKAKAKVKFKGYLEINYP